MYLSGFLCERASVLSSDLRAQAAALSVCVGSGYGSARLGGPLVLGRAWRDADVSVLQWVLSMWWHSAANGRNRCEYGGGRAEM